MHKAKKRREGWAKCIIETAASVCQGH